MSYLHTHTPTTATPVEKLQAQPSLQQQQQQQQQKQQEQEQETDESHVGGRIRSSATLTQRPQRKQIQSVEMVAEVAKRVIDNAEEEERRTEQTKKVIDGSARPFGIQSQAIDIATDLMATSTATAAAKAIATVAVTAATKTGPLEEKREGKEAERTQGELQVRHLTANQMNKKNDTIMEDHTVLWEGKRDRPATLDVEKSIFSDQDHPFQSCNSSCNSSSKNEDDMLCNTSTSSLSISNDAITIGSLDSIESNSSNDNNINNNINLSNANYAQTASAPLLRSSHVITNMNRSRNIGINADSMSLQNLSTTELFAHHHLHSNSNNNNNSILNTNRTSQLIDPRSRTMTWPCAPASNTRERTYASAHYQARSQTVSTQTRSHFVNESFSPPPTRLSKFLGRRLVNSSGQQSHSHSQHHLPESPNSESDLEQDLFSSDSSGIVGSYISISPSISPYSPASPHGFRDVVSETIQEEDGEVQIDTEVEELRLASPNSAYSSDSSSNSSSPIMMNVGNASNSNNVICKRGRISSFNQNLSTISESEVAEDD